MLVQAKLRQKSGGFGQLSECQKENLPANAAFSAFVLYGYEDEDRTMLSPFQWQSCAGAKLEEMEDWLKKGKLSEPLGSSEMIDLIYNKKLGTNDDSIIKSVIATNDRPRFEITLRWPKRGPDGPLIKLANSAKAQQQVYVY